MKRITKHNLTALSRQRKVSGVRSTGSSVRSVRQKGTKINLVKSNRIYR